MNDLRLFNFKNKGVRTLVRDEDVWFAGKDVCCVFGDTNHNRSLSRIRDEDKMMVPVDTAGGKQNINFINEAGLYDLLFSMQPQRAHHSGMPNEYPLETQKRIEELSAFKRFVTHEVLPQIRKTGTYGIESREELLARAVLASNEMIKERDAKIATQALKIEEDKPKVAFANAMSASKGSRLIAHLAKHLKKNGIDMGQNRMFSRLRSDKLLSSRKGKDWNMPTQKAMDLGLFEIVEKVITLPDGSVMSTRTVYVTNKGLEYLVNKYLNEKKANEELEAIDMQ
jgi:anti-repressor protein